MDGEQNGDCEMITSEEHIPLEESLRFAKKLFVHGGNIAHWSRTKRKTTPGPEEELSESISTTLSNCSPINKSCLGSTKKKAVRCVNSKFIEKISPAEREHLKISVKVFAAQLKPSLVQDALFRVMCDLGVDFVESLILALPEIPTGEGTLEALKAFWEEMEQLKDSGYVGDLGVADIDRPTLETLYTWAWVKPAVDQVNLASCCVMPKDLVEFSKTHDVQLLTHADPKDIFTQERLHDMVKAADSSVRVEAWKPVWAARYSVLVKCRGVIKNKGYVIGCEQSLGRD